MQNLLFMHQSIPAVPVPPTPSPPGNCGAFAHVVSPGGGAFATLLRLEAGNLYTSRRPRAFDTRVFESAMDEFIGKDDVFVEQWLVRQGLEKLADVFISFLLLF